MGNFRRPRGTLGLPGALGGGMVSVWGPGLGGANKRGGASQTIRKKKQGGGKGPFQRLLLRTRVWESRGLLLIERAGGHGEKVGSPPNTVSRRKNVRTWQAFLTVGEVAELGLFITHIKTEKSFGQKKKQKGCKETIPGGLP